MIRSRISVVADCRQHRYRQRGLSLVELMIGVLLGLMLMGASLHVLMSTRLAFKFGKESSNVQENARFAVEMLGREIALAGFTGCRRGARVANVLVGSGSPGNWRYGPPGIEAFDDAQAKSAYPSEFRDDMIAGTDAIIVRGGAGNALFTASGFTKPVFQFPIGSAVKATIDDGAVVLAANELCQQVAVFQVSSAAPDSLTYDLAGTPGNCSLELGSLGNSSCAAPNVTGPLFAAGTTVMPYSVSAFYIAPSAIDPSIPALWRQRLITEKEKAVLRKEELLQGVESLQLRYGYDTNDDGHPNYFLKANDASLIGVWDWSKVVNVRVGILLRSLAAVETTDQPNADFEGSTVPTDRYARHRVFTTVQLKNYGMN